MKEALSVIGELVLSAGAIATLVLIFKGVVG